MPLFEPFLSFNTFGMHREFMLRQSNIGTCSNNNNNSNSNSNSNMSYERAPQHAATISAEERSGESEVGEGGAVVTAITLTGENSFSFTSSSTRLISRINKPYEYVPDPKYAGERRSWMELPCIPDDDGVPPGCRDWKYCLLNHRNPILNNSYTKLIGNIGYEYFDDKRKTYLGVASMITIVAMIMTTFGCFALSTDRSIVQRTYWAGGSLYNITSDTYSTIYIGLRSVETVDCKFRPGYDSYPESCERHSIQWTDTNCKTGVAADACDTCASVASSLELAAFFNCSFLILSLLGAQTRMRRKADVPIQKMLGMGADLWGAVTLAYSLFIFFDDCEDNLRKAYAQPGMQNTFWLGNGFTCYEVCVFAALVRCTVHWLTPLPGQAKGMLAPICELFKFKNWPWCDNCCKLKSTDKDLLLEP